MNIFSLHQEVIPRNCKFEGRIEALNTSVYDFIDIFQPELYD